MLFSIIYTVLSCVVGGVYIYFGGIKRDWQKGRIDRGIINSSFKVPPGIRSRCVLGEKKFIASCISLLLFSIVSSLIVTIAIVLIVCDKDFHLDIKQGITIAVPLFASYVVIAGTPLKEFNLKNSITVSKHAYKNILKALNVISAFKKIYVDFLVNREFESIINRIFLHIDDWGKSESNRIGIFIWSLVENSIPEKNYLKKENYAQRLLQISKVYSENKPGHCIQLKNIIADAGQFDVKLHTIVEIFLYVRDIDPNSYPIDKIVNGISEGLSGYCSNNGQSKIILKSKIDDLVHKATQNDVSVIQNREGSK